MLKTRIITAVVACLLASVVFAAGLKISLFTNPKTYLKDFPLGTAQTEVYAELGAPASTLNMGAVTVWVYEYGEGYGARKFSFEMTDGKVTDVRYNDQGPYNGLTAKQSQGVK